MELFVNILLGAMSIYLTVGVVFGIAFHLGVGKKIDEGVKGTPWHFKLIVFPGLVLFWSVLITKLFKKS